MRMKLLEQKLFIYKRVYRQWSRRPAFNPRLRQTKDFKKCFLIPPCLTLSKYKVRIKGKEEQSRESSSAFPYTSV